MRSAFYAACALIGLLLATACAPKEIAPPAEPTMYAVELSDGTCCIAIENARGEALLVCDFEPVPNEIAAGDLL